MARRKAGAKQRMGEERDILKDSLKRRTSEDSFVSGLTLALMGSDTRIGGEVAPHCFMFCFVFCFFFC